MHIVNKCLKNVLLSICYQGILPRVPVLLCAVGHTGLAPLQLQVQVSSLTSVLKVLLPSAWEKSGW